MYPPTFLKGSYPEGKTVVPRGKSVVRGGKARCTPREAFLHPEGRIAVPRGKKIRLNFPSPRRFSIAQQDPTDLKYFSTTTATSRYKLRRTYQMLLVTQHTGGWHVEGR